MPTITPDSFEDSQGYGGGSGGGFPHSAYNLGQPMRPWLMPYGGDRTAPMSREEQEALGGFGNFARGGFGLSGARGALGGYESWLRGGRGMGGGQQYMDDVLGGKYLDPSSNRWLSRIEEGAKTRKALADSDALGRIGSSMAVGGNALSGARAGAESDYLARSGAAYNEDIGRLMSENYGRERVLQQGILPYMMEMGEGEGRAWGNLAGMHGDLAGRESQGWQDYLRAGGLPRNLRQQDLNASYDDWNRQIQGFRDEYRYGDQQMMNMLRGGGYPGERNREYGDSDLEKIMGLVGMAGGFGGGQGQQGGWANQLLQSGGQSLVNAIKGLFGGTASDEDVAAFLSEAEASGMTPEDLMGMVDYESYESDPWSAGGTDWGNFGSGDTWGTGGGGYDWGEFGDYDPDQYGDDWGGVDWSQFGQGGY